jgi:DNA-binding transcriptional LysR family regulator
MDRIALMQTFVTIVETGNLSTAAVQLGTTQPTVSRRLQALERSLGVALLQRSTHRMKLTPDGERCFERARELLTNWASFEADLRGDGDQPDGVLRVLVPHAFGQQMFVAPLAEYLQRYPRVAVEWLLRDDTPNFIAEGIDCALHVGDVRELSLVAIRLAEVPRIVVAAPSVLKGQPVPEHASELAALPWLALRTFYRNEVTLMRTDTGERQVLAIAPRMSTDSLFALRSAALMGMGACVASAWLLADDLAQQRLVQLAPRWQAPSLPVYLVYPQARFYPARLRRFVELMRARVPQQMSTVAV